MAAGNVDTRVLAIVSTYLGGPPRVLDSVLRHRPEGTRFAVVVIYDQAEEELAASSIACADELIFLKSRGRLDLQALRLFRQVVDDYRPDVIASFDFASNLLGWHAAGRRHIPWIPCVYGPVATFKFWRILVQRQTFRRAAKVIAPSRDLGGKLVSRRLAPLEKLAIIPNGAEIDGPCRGDLPPKDEVKIGCIANFYSEVKGQHVAIEAMTSLPAGYSIDFIGDGVLLPEAKSLVRALGLEDRVVFRGFLHHREVREALSHSDILVVPSLSESFGIVTVEGMAAGVPIVASAVGGLPEVVEDGVSGVLVPPGEPRVLARRIEEVCSSPQTWRQLRAAGMSRVRKRFSIGFMASEFDRVLQSVVERCVQL